jgi:hypothetical protein
MLDDILECYICDLKNKVIKGDIFWNLKGCFCKWFEPEERSE